MLRRGQTITIGSSTIGPGHPLFVIAEIGLNHDGSLARALALVDAAASAGASAIKLQTLHADGLVAPGAPSPAHVEADSMRDFFRRFELDEAAHRTIVARARERGLAVLATALSEQAVAVLERVGVDGYKIASGDITWERLIRLCARTRKPLVISTGMSRLEEAERALAWARAEEAGGVALMHCVSAYPVPPGSENLRAIATLAAACRTPVGLSDHGPDSFGVPLAVAMGASLYERHIMLERGDGSIDADVSSTPGELAAIVTTAARAVEALGSGAKICQPAERINLRASRRSLYAARPLSAGHVVEASDVIALRPAIGLTADRLDDLIGRRLPRDIEDGMPFLASDLAGPQRSERVA